MWSYAVKLDFMYAIYKFQMYPDQTYPLLASLVRSKNHVNWHKNNQKFNNYIGIFFDIVQALVETETTTLSHVSNGGNATGQQKVGSKF